MYIDVHAALGVLHVCNIVGDKAMKHTYHASTHDNCICLACWPRIFLHCKCN